MKGGKRMDQKKIGSFLKEIRNEKGITQEQAANEFGVAQRTVSRWETGSNMPDLSILIEIAEFYDVDIKEIIDGERKSENMDKETKETLQKVADYVDAEKEKLFKETIGLSIMAVISALGCCIACVLDSFNIIAVEETVKILLAAITFISIACIINCLLQIKDNGKKKSKINDADLCAYFTIIFGTISIPLVFTIYWWIVPVFLSFGTGYMAIKNKTEKTRYAIAGIVLSVIAVIFAIIYIAIGM